MRRTTRSDPTTAGRRLVEALRPGPKGPAAAGGNRRARRPVPPIALLFLPVLLIFSAPIRAAAQTSWLDFEDGEILNVSSADGPMEGEPFFQARHSVEHSTIRGTMAINRLRVLYGITPYMTGGISAVHLEQTYQGLFKKGLGDTNLSLKLHFRPGDLPLRLGLRQSLSLPTGYELEREGLARFTSGHNDYTAQALVQYVDSRFSTYLNPGVLLPGGNAGACLTGGIGFACTLPWSLDARGEYYTAWDMVAHRFNSEIFTSMRLPMPLGLSFQAGVKRRLLQKEQVDPEIQLSLCFGRDRRPEADAFTVRARRRALAGLLVHPIETAVPDPYGVTRTLTETFRSDENGNDGRVAVYVRSVPAENLEASRRGRTYELNVRILQIDEADVSGLEASPILRVTRSHTEITAQYELIAPDGYSVVRREVLCGRAARTLGIHWIPESGSVDATVTPDEVRTHLRSAAAKDLAVGILRGILQTIEEREAQ